MNKTFLARVFEKKSFTFIEIALVVAMISVISLAIYSSFSAGVKIWQRANANTRETDVCIFFDKISSDLRNCVLLYRIMPFGARDNLSFALIQEEGRQSKGTDDLANFGRVHYSFNVTNGKVLRSYKNYSRLLDTNAQEKDQVILENINSLAFSYYYRDKEGVWRDNFNGNFPSAVKVDVTFESNKKTKTLTKIIPIHISG